MVVGFFPQPCSAMQVEIQCCIELELVSIGFAWRV